MTSLVFRSFFGGVLAIATVSGGCVTFQEETLSYWHDTKADRVLVHVLYTGIHGDTQVTSRQEPITELTSNEQTELLDVAHGRQVFLFDNWLGVFDLDAICDELAAPPDFDRPAPERLADQALRDWYALLTVNVRIVNGPFFLDKEGRLSAVQYVTISNVSRLIRAANRAWRYQVEAFADELGGESARAIAEPVSLSGGQLILRHPTQRPDEDARTWAGGNRSRVEAGIVTLTIGETGALGGRIQLPVASTYAPNAVAFVRDRFGIATGFDPEADAIRFLGKRLP